jgi:hypothetical protein
MMDNLHPKYAYLIYGIIAFIAAIACIFLNREAEIEVIDV